MSLYDDASLILYPSGYKEDKIYSLKPTDGSGDLTFTRASTATRVNSDGLIETASVLGTELISSTLINSNYDTFNEASVSGFHAIYSTSGTQRAATLDEISFVTGKTYQVNIDVSVVSGSVPFLRAREAIATSPTIFSGQLVDGSNVVTFTSTNTLTGVLEFSSTTASEYRVSNVSVKEVITSNVPRIDYTGGGCGKLLLESQRTNLVTYSEDFSNAAWTKSGVTITANNTTSPDGTTNADKIVATAANSSHYIEEGATIASGATNTFSVFAKKGEYNYLYMNAYANVSLRTWFNLDTGEVGFNTAGNTASIEDYGNGWYRCIVTNTSIGTTGILQFGPAITNGTINATPTFLGDGTSGVYTYGASLEAGNYVSSYIPTLASSVTRIKDSAFKTGISSLIGQTEGTFFAEVDFTDSDADQMYLTLSDGTSNNRIHIGFDYTSNWLYCNIRSGGVAQGLITQSSPSAGIKKIAVAYAQDDYIMYINGVQVGADTSALVPACSRLDVGGYFSAGFEYPVKQALLFKTRLTNDQLADLTGGNITTFNDLATLYGYQII